MIGLKRTSVLVAAAGLWLCSAALAEDYEIRLNRPMKVGDTYQVSATGNETRKTRVMAGDQEISGQSESLAMELEAAVKVLAVDANATPSQVTLTVAKCLKVEGDTKTPLVPKDTVVAASLKDRKPFFEINGAPVDPEVQKALAIAITLGKGGANPDQAFGTTQRKKVGDRWTINADLTTEAMRKDGLEAKKEDVTGFLTIEKIVKVEETECLQLGAELNIANINGAVPAGFALDKATFQSRITSVLPVNTALPPRGMSGDFTVTFILKGKPNPDGPEIVVETVGTRHVTTKMTYPK